MKVAGLNDEGICLAVKKTCSGNYLGLADCDDPETKWVDAGGQLLSAFCWSQGESAALVVDRGCTDLTVDDVAASTITTFNTFLLFESDFIESIGISPTVSPTYYPTTSPTP